MWHQSLAGSGTVRHMCVWSEGGGIRKKFQEREEDVKELLWKSGNGTLLGSVQRSQTHPICSLQMEVRPVSTVVHFPHKHSGFWCSCRLCRYLAEREVLCCCFFFLVFSPGGYKETGIK